MDVLESIVAGLSRRLGREPGFRRLSASWLDQFRNFRASAVAVPDALYLSCALLSFSEDIRMFVQSHELLDEFSLLTSYSVSPYPLFNLNGNPSLLMPERLRRILRAPAGCIAAKFGELSEFLGVVFSEQLLGKNTAGKMAFVRSICGQPLRRLTREHIEEELLTPLRILSEPFQQIEAQELDVLVLTLARRTRELLLRQLGRIGSTHLKSEALLEAIRRIDRLFPRSDLLRHRLRMLVFGDPRRAVGSDSLCFDYADDVVQILHEEDPCTLEDMAGQWRYVSGKGVEVAFAPRDMSFFLLGDRYGDCTAFWRRKQLDKRLLNIHTTVYTWFLDPFYRVLQVFSDGEAVLKAHLLPLVINDQSVLMVDAIEVVPEIRGPVNSGGDARQTSYMVSDRLWQLKGEIIGCLEQQVSQIAVEMGVDAVLVDCYSNAPWVREWVEGLDTCCYHVGEVQKPFGYQIHEWLWRRWTGHDSARQFQMEIQAVNLGLIDHGMRTGYKNAGILRGSFRGGRLALRGP